MSARRKLAESAVAGVTTLVLVLIGAVAGGLAAPGMAGAHGATSSPVSRADACGPEGGANARSAACQAAAAANGGQPVSDFDNIRVANVAGRDRELIPDGKLCSAGIPRFAGLDVPRTDWPSTQLASGAAFTFRYRVTIPHTGSFRLYVTKDTYDPTKALTWDTLQSKPFATFTDPVAKNGVYSLPGTLPTGKAGRHIIYVIWQTTSTPDTYYSCSDVVFTKAAAAGGSNGAGGSGLAPGAGGAPSAGTAIRPAPGSSNIPPAGGVGGGAGGGAVAGAGAGTSAEATPAPQSSGKAHKLRLVAGLLPGGTLGLAAGGGAVLILLVLGGIFVIMSMRRKRPNHVGRHR